MGATYNFRYSIRNTLIGLGSVSAITYIYFKIEEINDILGTDIMTTARRQLQKDLSFAETEESDF
jgi:hypothetical protein